MLPHHWALPAGQREQVGPPVADGSPLLTDHYAPVTDEPCDTVLVRFPYGRGFPWNSPLHAGHHPALLIGRWTHTSAYDPGWSKLFGQAMGRMRGAEPAARVRVHVGGADEWRELSKWPPDAATPRPFHLGPGTLGAEPGTGATTFHYDPADPTPSIGRPLQSNTNGPRDDATLEKRADVRTFNYGTGEPIATATRMVATDTTVRHTSALILPVV